MNRRHIRAEAWEEFERRFPAAQAFLLHQSLIGEWLTLKRDRMRAPLGETLERRFQELDGLYGGA